MSNATAARTHATAPSAPPGPPPTTAQKAASKAATFKFSGTLTPLRLDDATRKALDEPFDKVDTRQDAFKQGDNFQPKYPAPAALIRRLNEATGHTWNDELLSHFLSPDQGEVIAIARLSVTARTEDGQIITSFKDGVGGCLLKNGSRFSYDLKQAHSDAIRKAASKFNISLHMYERDESHFQGYDRLNIPTDQRGDKQATRHLVEQAVGILEGQFGLDRAMWLKNLKLSAPENISIAEAMQLIDGSHAFLLWLKKEGYVRRGEPAQGGLITEDA